MKQLNQKGFTLIELMTVVAIIATLATVGVPQYRKFQRRARRAEANMILGVVASSMSVFNAEYKGVTNNLGALGVDLESRPQAYHAGFIGSDGANQDIRLRVPGSAGALESAPDDFSFKGWDSAQLPGTLLGGAAAPSTRIIGVANLLDAAAGGTKCEAGVVNAYVSDQLSYTASACGNIGGGRNDQITINEKRQISIVQDGST